MERVKRIEGICNGLIGLDNSIAKSTSLFSDEIFNKPDFHEINELAIFQPLNEAWNTLAILLNFCEEYPNSDSWSDLWHCSTHHPYRDDRYPDSVGRSPATIQRRYLHTAVPELLWFSILILSLVDSFLLSSQIV